ncbi:hypothetical protein KBZ94_40185 [Streptomyces sp. RM72]|uniref:protein-glutamine glutaminase family protein n=1 Tax=Streptomyces sp. RM72 TaxID=1115510 RepID=UPI001B35D69B|nr:protein-glutamine glutaminase family protein [Streptomyces sp. RM72]MBQ0891065.1 hypothetical protein [Streptomyces sp. RM72]
MARTDRICFGFPSPLMDVMDGSGSSPLRAADVRDFAGDLRQVASIYLKTIDEPPPGLTPEEALRALARIAPQRLTEKGMTEALRHRLLHAVHDRIQREDARRELPEADPDSPAQQESGRDHFLLTDVRSVLVSTAGAEFSRHVIDEELDAAVQQVKRSGPPPMNTRARAEAAVQELLNGGPVLLRGGTLGPAGHLPVHQHVRRFANTSHAVQGADYDFVSPPVQQYLETGGYTLGSQGVTRGRRSPWGDQSVFVVRALWGDDFGKVVLLENGEVEAKYLHEFAEIVSSDPELAGLQRDVPIVMVINSRTPRILWSLARFTALMTNRTVWFTSQRSSLGADPYDADSVVINLPHNESGRWAKVLPSDMREMDSSSSLNSHSGPVADGDIRLDVIVDFDTKRPVGAFSHSPEETLKREERLQILSDVSTYSQGIARGNEIVVVPGGERPVPWPQDTWFWMSRGVPGYALLQENGDAREPLYVNAQEFGAFMARFLREHPLSPDTRIVLVVCYGATLAQAVADATGRVVYAAHTQVGGSLELDRQDPGQEQLWLSFPPRPSGESRHPVRAYPVHVDSPSGDDISRRALRDRLATIEPGTPGYERAAKALATWETANTRPSTGTVPDADRTTAQALVDGHYPGATIEHVSPTAADVLDRLMRERPSDPQERPSALPAASERQPGSGHEAPETVATTEATVAADTLGSALLAPDAMPSTGPEPSARERAWTAPAAPTAEEAAVAVEAAYADLIARHLSAPRVDARGLLATLRRRGSTPSLFTPTSLRAAFQQVTGADPVTAVNAAVLQGRLSMDNHHEVLRGLGLVSDFFFADESPQEDVALPSAHHGSRSPDVVEYVRQVHRAYASNDPERVLTLLRDLDRDMRKVWAVEAAWQERSGAPLRQSLAAVWPGYADRVGHVLGDVDDSPVPMAQAETWYRQLHTVTFEHPERGIVPVTTEYPDEGCYLRAHLWARELLRWGAAPRKAIGASARLTTMSAHARGATAAAPKQVQWRYHVAPVVNVFGARGAVAPVVLDPTLGLGPLSVRDWARAIGIPAVSGGQDVFEGPLDQVHGRLAEQERRNPGNWQFAERKLPVRPMLLLTDGHAFRFPYPDERPPASWQETDALVQQEEDTLFLHHFRAARRNLARRLQGIFQQVTDAHTSEQVREALKAQVAPYLTQEELLEGFLQGYPDVEATARRLLSDAHYDEFEGFFPPPEDSEEHPDYSSEEEMDPGDEMFLDEGEDEDEDEEQEQEEPGPARRSPARARGWEPPASWTAPPLAASPTEAEAHGAPDRTQGVEPISWADMRRRAEPAVIATEVFDPLRSGPYEPGRLPGAMSEVLLDARRFQTASGEWISDATVRVHLAPHGVSADDTRFLAERTTGAVRRLINEPRFRLPDGSVFHFSVEFLARPETAHHLMAVHAEPGVTTTAEVHLVDGSGTPLTEYQLVHEFLHFLGLPDRYYAPGYVFRDRPWSGRVALDGSLTAGEPVGGLPVLNAEDLAAIGQVFGSGPVIRHLAHPSAGQAEDTPAPGSPDLVGDAVPSPKVRRDATALIEEFDAGIRPALRVWEDPVADEFDRLTDEVLTDWGSRSLVFGLHEGPLWVINMEGALRILTEDGLPVSLPKTADGPVVSLDIGTDGRLVGPAANLPGGDAAAPPDTKAGFCDVNLGADLSRVLGRSPADRR